MINTRQNYIEIGTSVAKSGNNYILQNSLKLPVPNKIPSSNQFMVNSERNSVGELTIKYVGRTNYKTKITWNKLPNKTWWAINRWFENNGYDFYMRYFNHSDGKIMIHKFYRGEIGDANPSEQTEILNGIVVPMWYYDCEFSIIDMGLKNQITEKTIGV